MVLQQYHFQECSRQGQQRCVTRDRTSGGLLEWCWLTELRDRTDLAKICFAYLGSFCQSRIRPWKLQEMEMGESPWATQSSDAGDPSTAVALGLPASAPMCAGTEHTRCVCFCCWTCTAHSPTRVNYHHCAHTLHTHIHSHTRHTHTYTHHTHSHHAR